MPTRGRSTIVLVVAALAALLLVGRGLSTLLVEQAWYERMGATALWQTQITSTLLLKLGGWLLGTGFAFANLWAVRLTIQSVAVPTRVADLELVEMLTARQLFRITLLAAAAVGVVLTLPLDDGSLLTAVRRGVPFREYEGIFQRDLGFYVHWLPFESALYTWALVAIVVVSAIVTLLYALTRSLRFEGRQLIARTHVRRHLTVLGALVLALLSWSYRLDAYELLLWGSGFDGSFTAVDHRYTTRVDLVLAVATLAGALIVLRTGWIGQVRAAFVTVTLVLVGALGVRQAGPGIAERAGWFALPEGRRNDYDATRAIFTRRAYGVEAIRVDEPGDSTPAAPPAGLGRVAVWDANALSALRPSAGDDPAVLVTRPGWQPGPSGADAVLVTRTTSVTPVWDVRLLAGSQVRPDGERELARHPALRGIALPEPLVAPDQSGYRLVDASAGTGGPAFPSTAGGESTVPGFDTRRIPAIPLDGLGRRLALAWATRDASLLAEAETGGAAVVLHRDVRERVGRLVPRLAQGRAVTPILPGGSLLWALDLYSASTWFPLSIRLNAGGTAQSYFRHAGTALVEAHTGAVRIVRTGSPDPIAQTWFGLVPGLVVAAETLPSSLRALLPIPTDGAYATARAFARVGSRRTGNAPRFVPDSLPGTDPYPVHSLVDGAVAWSLPLVDGTDQLVGTFVARGGTERAPHWRPVSEPLPRWRALTTRLATVFDSVTSALAGAQEGPLVAGGVRTLVIDGRPWLMRPAYADEGGVPHLVALAVVGDTLALAVRGPDALPGGVRRTDVPEATPTLDARRLYDAAREAMQRGDWLRFGATMDSLGRALSRTP